MSLGLRERSQLRNFLLNQSTLSFKPSAKLMIYLKNDYADLFRLKGSLATFTSNNKQTFRQEVSKDIPDLFAKISDADDRVDAAVFLKNEKLAPVSPEQSHVTLAQHQGYFFAAGIIGQLPLGTSVRVAIDELIIEKIETLVVVENLNAFDNWYKVNWANISPKTYAVYRGHDRLTKSVASLINKVADNARVIAFCDYDLKGLEIALTTKHINETLLPNLHQLFLSKFNRPELYAKQYRSLAYIRKQLGRHSAQSIQALMDDLKPISVMQEHLLAHRIPMQAILLV